MGNIELIPCGRNTFKTPKAGNSVVCLENSEKISPAEQWLVSNGTQAFGSSWGGRGDGSGSSFGELQATERGVEILLHKATLWCVKPDCPGNPRYDSDVQSRKLEVT